MESIPTTVGTVSYTNTLAIVGVSAVAGLILFIIAFVYNSKNSDDSIKSWSTIKDSFTTIYLCFLIGSISLFVGCSIYISYFFNKTEYLKYVILLFVCLSLCTGIISLILTINIKSIS
jgi:ABC-type multidrug transport system permease subunit